MNRRRFAKKIMVWGMSLVLLGSATPKTVCQAKSEDALTKGQNYQIAYWKDFSRACVTYTFDDGYDSHFTMVKNAFDDYGYKATLFVITSLMTDAKWTSAKQMSDEGYEIGSHTVTHSYLSDSNADEELGNSKSIIEEKIGKSCLTVAYPYCVCPTQSYVEKYYIGGRGVSGTYENATPYNYISTGSIIVGDQGTAADGDAMVAKIQAAKNADGWAIFMIHGFSDYDSGSYSPITEADLRKSLSYVYDNKDDYWVATFAEAIKYAKERDNATISGTDIDSNTKLITLTDSLDNSVYDQHLSLRVKNDKNWENVSVSQNGKTLKVTLDEDYIYFDAQVDAGNIVITNIQTDSNVKVDVCGYQISTKVEGFRTLYTVEDPDNEISEFGLLYGIEGISDTDNFVVSGDKVFSYQGTSSGKIDAELTENGTAYAMTMDFGEKTKSSFTAEYYVRAYAKLKDGSYVYGKINHTSIYKLADKLYSESMAPNFAYHQYLYNEILSLVDSEYNKIDYNWNKIYFLP